MKKNLSPFTALIFVASFVLFVMGAHIAYVMNANSQIAKEVANNPALAGKIRINYGNLPHTEYLIYGALIGLGVGTLTTVAYSIFGTKLIAGSKTTTYSKKFQAKIDSFKN